MMTGGENGREEKDGSDGSKEKDGSGCQLAEPRKERENPLSAGNRGGRGM